MTEIDPFPVAELQNRYSIGKQAVYNRLDALAIKPAKQGNRSFINSEQLRSLDTLHNHLKNGGTMADFNQTESIISPLRTVDLVDGAIELPSSNFSELVALVGAIAQHLRPAEPLLHLKELERAAAAGWLLSSDEVRQLIGIKPSCKKGNRTFTRGSFSFIRRGKIGNQSAWQVMKVNN